MHPSHPTADLFFTRQLESGKIIVVVGDLSGKGITPSLDDQGRLEGFSCVGAKFVCDLHDRLDLHPHWDAIVSPEQVVHLIDQIFGEIPQVGGKQFALTVAIVDPRSRSVTASVLGDTQVYIYEPNGTLHEIGSRPPSLGFFPIDSVPVFRAEGLSPGTRVLCATDGLIDSSSHRDSKMLFSSDPGEPYGLPSLLEALRVNAPDDWGYIQLTL